MFSEKALILRISIMTRVIIIIMRKATWFVHKAFDDAVE